MHGCWTEMVPKIVAKGRSFKGAAAYLLHDKGQAQTDERVEWVETRNLATQDPELAWRIMAATALDQDRLKDAAGVRKSGRKSNQAALHMVLSWHPDEREGLTRDEMRKAAIGALRAIGADDRQVMLIAHNDEAHAHLHVLCNRVSSEDGRMLSSSKDRLKLSKWAQNYEMERGQVYCENRVVNNERRDQGEYVADDSALPYHQAANERHAPDDERALAFAALKAAQTFQDRALVERGIALAETHKVQWAALSERLEGRRAAIRDQVKSEIAKAKAEIGTHYAPLRRDQNARHRHEQERFEQGEARLLGRIANTMKAVDYIRRIRGEDASIRLARGFQVLSSKGARQEALRQLQMQDKDDLNRKQAREIADAKKSALREGRAARQKALSEYEASRLILVQRQVQENRALKVAWQQRTAERRAAFAAYQAGRSLPYVLGAEFNDASGSDSKKRRQSDDGGLDAMLERLDRERDQYDFGNDNEPDHDDDYER